MKPRLVIATGNQGKFLEFKRALSVLNVELLSAKDAGIGKFPAEEGSTYEENALIKAAFVALHTGLPSLADDSGLEVDVLDGAPGVYSARFGGNISDGERIAFLLDKIRHVPQAARSAGFLCTLALATPGGEVKVFEGECRGEILQGPRGSSGFGYDPIFFSHDLRKSFAEASEEEKQRVSHRGRAIKKFIDWALSPTAKSTLNPENRSARRPDMR